MASPRLLALPLLAALGGCELIVHPDDVEPPAACQPTTCAEQGKDCGEIDDGCGAPLSCGSCELPDLCGGGGVDHVCAPCRAQCTGRECGPDGCGNLCGHCTGAEVCDTAAGQCVACLADTDCDPSGAIACDGATHRCQADCAQDADCAQVSGSPRCDPATRECVPCLAEADCVPPTSHCLTATRGCVACRDDADCPLSSAPHCREHTACVACLTASDCASPTPLCDASGTCVECRVAGDCASGLCGADGRCHQGGDTCSAPLPLTVVGGLASALGDTTGLGDDTTTAGCGGGGPDVVYRLVLGAAQDVDVVVWPESDTFRPVVAVRSACADESAQAELDCAKAREAGQPAAVSFASLPAGTYYVWVDGLYTSKGPFSLSVLLRAPGSASGEACASARPLSFDAEGWAFAEGDTTALADDAQGQCGGDGAADQTFSLTLTEARSLDATVSALEPLELFTPVLTLSDARTGCAAASELACQAADTGPGEARLVYPRLEAGTWLLTVDGADASPGAFALRVSLADPINDTCAAAADLAFDASGKATVQGSTVQALDDTSSSGCGGYGADVFYRLTVSAGATLTAKVTPAAASADYDPIVSLRSACADSSTERGCVQGAGEILSVTGLAAGTYYLVVDGYFGTSGDFTLEVAR